MSPPAPLALAYYTALFVHAAAFLLLALSKDRAGLWLLRAAVAVLAVAVSMICWQTGRPPLYGMFEIVLSVALVTGLCGIFGRGGDARHLYKWVIGANLILLLFGLLRPKVPGLDFFMYAYPWTLGFFFLRLLALGCLLFAALAFLASLTNHDQRQALTWRGRNYLLLGCALFLGGEMSGSYWALNWMGDFWLWGRGFLMSTLMFLSAMFAFHLPAGLGGRPRLAAALGALPGVLAMLITIWSQIAEGV